MPNNIGTPTVYADPENMDTPTLYAPGHLGARFTVYVPLRSQPGLGPVPETGASKSYQVVQTDSAMNIAPTRTLIAWWKDKAKYIVTTDQNAIDRNLVAGVFKNNVVKGNYTCIQYKGPASIAVIAADAPNVVLGDSAIPSAAGAGQAARIAKGTAPTHTLIGVFAGPGLAGNIALCILAIPETT